MKSCGSDDCYSMCDFCTHLVEAPSRLAWTCGLTNKATDPVESCDHFYCTHQAADDRKEAQRKAALNDVTAELAALWCTPEVT